MPGLNGIELLHRVRGDYPKLPFILFTGQGSEGIASEATTGGATAYVRKGGPEVYQLLANQVEQSVAHRRSERRARVANDRLLAFYGQTDGFYMLGHDWAVLYWNQGTTTRRYSTSEDDYGLHIVESLVEMHDWRISVTESEGE